MSNQTQTFTKTVRYTEGTNDKFTKLADKLGRDKRIVFQQMVDYFYKSKKDPLDLNDELLKNTLLKQHKDYIGFIKTQEQDLLVPIKREVGRMIDSQKQVLDNFNNQVTNANKKIIHNQEQMLNHQLTQAGRFKATDEMIQMVHGRLSTKDHLKKQFTLILEGYIKGREGIKMMSSSKDKEELMEHAREQIRLL